MNVTNSAHNLTSNLDTTLNSYKILVNNGTTGNECANMNNLANYVSTAEGADIMSNNNWI